MNDFVSKWNVRDVRLNLDILSAAPRVTVRRMDLALDLNLNRSVFLFYFDPRDFLGLVLGVSHESFSFFNALWNVGIFGQAQNPSITLY